MKKILFSFLLVIGGSSLFGQGNAPQNANFHSVVSSMEFVSSLSSRPNDLIPSDNSVKEPKDKRAKGNQNGLSQNPNDVDDVFAKNPHPLEKSKALSKSRLAFDGFGSGSTPTDPSLAVGPNHVIVTFNTGFAIYDKLGTQLVPQTSPSPAIFPNGGCCDLTASYDNAADRWVLTFLGNGAQIAVSDGPNPVTAGWYIYNIPSISDYQKLSVWSDGYYITDNTSSSNKVWALERAAMLAGDPTAQIIGFDLPGIQTFGFFSPQALNVTDSNLPAAGGATIIYLQDDNWPGVSVDHVKVWTIDVDWANAGSSTISSPQQINVTPFINVFDNGSFSNLSQPKGGGRASSVDALQATVMNQAQFRKFATHNSAVFNFVVDTDASNGELAGIRWYEFRQSGDNQPWTMYQEGTYTAPDGRHAWHASMAMDASGNIGMGYTSMSGPNTPSTVRISSYYTGRFSGDPLGTMTGAEQLIANGDANIPSTRYGDYSKMDVDPSDDETFWFINEYMNSGRKGVVGSFKVQQGSGDTEAPSTPTNLAANNITSSGADLSWTASTDNVGVTQYNVFIDGGLVGTTASTSFTVSGLSASTNYTATVNAEDAAGNVSGNGTTSFTTQGGGGNPGQIAAYYFETGLEGWTDGGNDCARQSSGNSFEGSFSIRLRDGSSTSNAISPDLDLTGNTQVQIEFHAYGNSMEAGESLIIEFFDGSSYQTIGQYVSGTDFNNGAFFDDIITLNAATSTFTTANNLRFRTSANSNNDQLWFDQVIISGDNATSAKKSATAIQAEQLAKSNPIAVYPNPAQKYINFKVLEGEFDRAMIFSVKGELIQTIEIQSQDQKVDISQLPKGMYFVRFVEGKLAVTKRFVKE